MSPIWQSRNVVLPLVPRVPIPSCQEWGCSACRGSVKAGRRFCARRREGLTGSAASSTMRARGNGSDPSEIGSDISTLLNTTFLLCCQYPPTRPPWPLWPPSGMLGKRIPMNRPKFSSKYLALLRGVNVGGRNLLPMRELTEIFANAGCADVRTYIQSGNVVFSAPPGALQG